MSNGFLVVDDKDWEKAEPEQRSWMIFNTLKSMDARLKKLERWNVGTSFIGGIIGGAASFFGIKIGG